jgi:hypothetical protein
MGRKRTFPTRTARLPLDTTANADRNETINLSELQSIFRDMVSANRQGYSSTDTSDPDRNGVFFGGMLPGEALDALENGWKNAPAISELSIPALPARIDETVFYNDVCGDILDIGAYCAGLPECLIQTETRQTVGTKILRFAVEIGGSWAIPAHAMRHRGTAMVALINALELSGYSVELTIIRSFAEDYGDGTKHVYLIPIKQAGEVLNMPLVQFAIGHPSFFRRCLFGLSEHKMGKSMHESKAKTTNYKPEGFTHFSHTDGLSNSEAESLKWAESMVAMLSAE